MKAMTALTISAVSTQLAQACAMPRAAAARVARRLAQAWRRRHQAAELAALDDHLLADIGLTRADLTDALSRLPWRDPIAALARRQCKLARGDAALERHAAPSLVPGADALAFPPRDPPARLTL
jgi:uncharacterized protein YjiS (DUF1127 family)